MALKALRSGSVQITRLGVALQLLLPGLVLEPLAWCQELLLRRRLRRLELPQDPVVIVGHWRSGTTLLHQLLAADPHTATARNSLTIAPQVAVLLKPLLVPLLQRLMTRTRPIDALPWSAEDPQEDEIGLARLCFDTNMAGVAFCQNYLHYFRRYVLASSLKFERELLAFTKLTWLHDGQGKRRLLIKNPAHTARVALFLRLFPRAKFVFIQREPVDSIRSLVHVKQVLGDLVGLQTPLDSVKQVEETTEAHSLLLEAFARDRLLIPKDQLVEVAYAELVADPLATVERIYAGLDLGGWVQAREAIALRVQQALAYKAQPVRLSTAAEKRLQELMHPAGAAADP